MTKPYALIADLSRELETPEDGILSRPIYQDEQLKVVLFAFSTGKELSGDTAGTMAILHFLGGEADVSLGTERIVASAGTWMHMAAQLPHSIRTRTSVEMLLLLLKSDP